MSRCFSQTASCKEHHKKEKQAENQATLAPLIAAMTKNGNTTAKKDQGSDAKPLGTCSDICGLTAKTFEDPVAFFTLMLSFVVWFQFVWMIRQEDVLVKSVSAAEKSAEAARDAADSALSLELPYLEPTGIWARGFENEWGQMAKCSVQIEMRNYGKTPAFPSEIRFASFYGDHLTKSSAVNTFSVEKRVGWLQLLPGQDVRRIQDTIDAPVLTAGDVKSVREGSAKFWIIATIKFRDYWRKKYIASFCFVWDKEAAHFVLDENSTFNYQRKEK